MQIYKFVGNQIANAAQNVIYISARMISGATNFFDRIDRAI